MDPDGDEAQEVILENAWGRKNQGKEEYLVARDGDHLLVPFECDTCIFRKLKGHSPRRDKASDKLLLASIRRVNLDAFWSRATSTVKANRDKIKMSLRLSETVGLQGPYEQEKPLPMGDYCGYEVAIQMVLYSRRSGRYHKEYTQFDTIRKVRSAYSNFVRASNVANQSTWSLVDQSGRYLRLSNDPCGTLWFTRFMEGCKRRMGQDWRPNRGMKPEVIKMILDRAGEKKTMATSDYEKNLWVVFRAFVAIGYTLSFRGNEVFLLDLKGLREKNGPNSNRDYLRIALRGKVKGEQNHRLHLLPCVRETSSGIPVGQVLSQLIEWKAAQGLFVGPAISNNEGHLLNNNTMDELLHDILEEICNESPELFPDDVRDREQIATSYQMFRTLRRSSDTRAIEKGVGETDTNVINRWRKKEEAKGRRPAQKMTQHYAEAELLVAPFLRYTMAM